MSRHREFFRVIFFLLLGLFVASTALAQSSGANISMSDSSPAASGTGWTYASNIYTVLDGADVTVTGSNQQPASSQRRIEVAANATATITLDGATIIGLDTNQSPLRLNGSANLRLTLATGSTNTLTAGVDAAGIRAPAGTTLTIGGTGTVYANGGGLYTTGGAGIGGYAEAGGTIRIIGGTVNATGVNDGAGIGGGIDSAGGTITISGGTVNAVAGVYASGIGGGTLGGSGTIRIDGGEVTAVGGSHGGAGIGGIMTGASNTITITGGEVTATGGGGANASAGAGAGIGSATGQTGGVITISGGTVYANGGSSNSYGGAGIGGGAASGGNTTISGGIVFAKGGQGSAGIGGGRGSAAGAGGNITISGGTVNATGGNGSSDGGGGAGIGSKGGSGTSASSASGNITITGGEVTAVGGAGIGTGGGGAAIGTGGARSGGTVGAVNSIVIPSTDVCGTVYLGQVWPTGGMGAGGYGNGADIGYGGGAGGDGASVIPGTTTTCFTIDVAVGAGGSVTPANGTAISNTSGASIPVSATRYENKQFTVAADPGHVIASVLLNGTPQTIVNKNRHIFVIQNISANHSVVVAFAAGLMVGTQSGTLTYGTAGNATFDVTATVIGDGTYTAILTGAPAGMTGSVIFSGGVGTLTINTTTTTPPGTYPLTLTIDGIDSNSFDLTVDKATPPPITWPTASAIAYGQTLADSTLTGGLTTHGSFDWDDGTIAPAFPGGNYSVTFTPFDTDNYDWSGVALTENVPITVNAVPIAAVAVMVGAPATGVMPNTAVIACGTSFTCGAVSWSPNHNPFQGGTPYTATVTLTVNSGYTFTGLSNATINGEMANIDASSGDTVTLSYMFAPTATNQGATAIPMLNPAMLVLLVFVLGIAALRQRRR